MINHRGFNIGSHFVDVCAVVPTAGLTAECKRASSSKQYLSIGIGSFWSTPVHALLLEVTAVVAIVLWRIIAFAGFR